MVSTANLPAECQPFGGDLIWADKFAEMSVAGAVSSRRNLRYTKKRTCKARFSFCAVLENLHRANIDLVRVIVSRVCCVWRGEKDRRRE